MKTKKETPEEAYERGWRVGLRIALKMVEDAPKYSKAWSLRTHLLKTLDERIKR